MFFKLASVFMFYKHEMFTRESKASKKSIFTGDKSDYILKFFLHFSENYKQRKKY